MDSVLVGISEGRRPLGLSRHIWEDNIKVDVSKTVWEVRSKQ